MTISLSQNYNYTLSMIHMWHLHSSHVCNSNYYSRQSPPSHSTSLSWTGWLWPWNDSQIRLNRSQLANLGKPHVTKLDLLCNGAWKKFQKILSQMVGVWIPWWWVSWDPNQFKKKQQKKSQAKKGIQVNHHWVLKTTVDGSEIPRPTTVCMYKTL